MLSPEMDPESLSDEKAFECLCGSDTERRAACAYYYGKYKLMVLACVRRSFPFLPADLVATATNDAFVKFYEVVTQDREFDPDAPQRLIIKIAVQKACDLLRLRTHRGKYKEESLEVIGDALRGTETAIGWSEAVGAGRAREIQELFRLELESFAPRQRNIARLIVDRIDQPIGPAELAALYAQVYNEPITVPAAKRARDEVRQKFRECMKKKGIAL